MRLFLMKTIRTPRPTCILRLCKYGVEYVEDPKTKTHTYGCNRTQFTSIFADEDYNRHWPMRMKNNGDI